MGVTQAQLAERLGVHQTTLSRLERGIERPSLAVALNIEALSGGRIDAADLCEDVRAARAACRHGCDIAADANAASPGKDDAISPDVPDREAAE